MIVDTMVFAYALLGVTKHRELATRILASAERIEVPDLVRAELANVVSLWVRHEGVPLSVALAALEDCEALVDRVWAGDALWARAVELAVEREHPVYDTMFVALAETLGTPVVSFDGKLRRKFPEFVVSAEDMDPA